MIIHNIIPEGFFSLINLNRHLFEYLFEIEIAGFFNIKALYFKLLVFNALHSNKTLIQRKYIDDEPNNYEFESTTRSIPFFSLVLHLNSGHWRGNGECRHETHVVRSGTHLELELARLHEPRELLTHVCELL